MTLPEFLIGIEQSAIGQAMSGESRGSEWLFPIVETLHVISIVVVFGTIVMVDLRLLGLTTRQSPVSKLTADILPFTWIAFGSAVVTGVLLFTSRAHTYFYSWAFDLKFLCMFLAGLNMLVFNFGPYRSFARWDNQLPPPMHPRIAGALSIILWTGVIFFGRWIGFST